MARPGQSNINASTRLCAVYGCPIRHSASPAIHNAAFAALGLNWRYLAFEVHPDHLSAAMEGARAMGFAGLNLTVPHKLLAFDLVDALDKSAKQWGAVNTIRFEGRSSRNRWLPLREFGVPRSSGRSPAGHPPENEIPQKIRAVGFNTDADAIITALREDLGMKLRGAKVLLLGAGGAGRTAALRMAAENVAQIFLLNRTSSKAEAVAVEIKRRFRSVRVALGCPESNVDLLINATSLGLKPQDQLPFDTKRFSLKQVASVYDMIYRPAETLLLKTARRAGCRTANGLGMLLYQGAKAFEIWTGQRAPLEVMRRALEKNIYGH